MTTVTEAWGGSRTNFSPVAFEDRLREARARRATILGARRPEAPPPPVEAAPIAIVPLAEPAPTAVRTPSPFALRVFAAGLAAGGVAAALAVVFVSTGSSRPEPSGPAPQVASSLLRLVEPSPAAAAPVEAVRLARVEIPGVPLLATAPEMLAVAAVAPPPASEPAVAQVLRPQPRPAAWRVAAPEGLAPAQPAPPARPAPAAPAARKVPPAATPLPESYTRIAEVAPPAQETRVATVMGAVMNSLRTVGEAAGLPRH